jgi:hypothetical protein
MRASGKAKTVIWRWQEWFGEEGVAGPWRDKTRPSRIAPLGPELAERHCGADLGRAAAKEWPGLSTRSNARGVV